jgi:hypothetical protein
MVIWNFGGMVLVYLMLENEIFIGCPVKHNTGTIATIVSIDYTTNMVSVAYDDSKYCKKYCLSEAFYYSIQSFYIRDFICCYIPIDITYELENNAI